MARRLLSLAICAFAGCGGGSAAHRPAPAPAAAPRGTGSFTLSVVSTNDVHGHMAAADGKGGLPLFGGYLANLRAARGADGGGVVLLDAGDAFQGTLDSNLDEGATVVKAYQALDYDAMAVGNHELDFGQKALFARAKEAPFPFLTANILEEGTDWPPKWAKKSKIVNVAGIKIGVIGVATIDTPIATAAVNIRGLSVVPLVPAILAQAESLRKRGCTVILLAAHAGAKCEDVSNPDDIKSCDDGEIFKVARQLPPGTVDAILAGHTHKAIAHRVNGIPIVEAFSNSEAFSRIDLTIDRATGKAIAHKILPPQAIVPGSYEGAAVVADAKVTAIIEPALTRAEKLRDEKLGWVVPETLVAGYDAESALGDVVTDLLLAAFPKVDIAVVNSGALHANLVAGPLTYGRLFDVYPFDNHVAFVKLTGAHLKKVVLRTLKGSRGVLLFSGVKIRATCTSSKIDVTLHRPDGKVIHDGEMLTVVTSDFLVGDGIDFALAKLDLPRGSITIDTGDSVRDHLARVLRERGRDPKLVLMDAKTRHLEYPGKRPVTCAGAAPAPPAAD